MPPSFNEERLIAEVAYRMGSQTFGELWSMWCRRGHELECSCCGQRGAPRGAHHGAVVVTPTLITFKPRDSIGGLMLLVCGSCFLFRADLRAAARERGF